MQSVFLSVLIIYFPSQIILLFWCLFLFCFVRIHVMQSFFGVILIWGIEKHDQHMIKMNMMRLYYWEGNKVGEWSNTSAVFHSFRMFQKIFYTKAMCSWTLFNTKIWYKSGPLPDSNRKFLSYFCVNIIIASTKDISCKRKRYNCCTVDFFMCMTFFPIIEKTCSYGKTSLSIHLFNLKDDMF